MMDADGAAHRKWMADARVLMKPSPVDHSKHSPKWFLRALVEGRQRRDEEVRAERAVKHPGHPDWSCPKPEKFLLKEHGYGYLGYYARSHIVALLKEIGVSTGWGCRWLDHDGSTVWHGREAWVSEPYGLDAESLNQIELVARYTRLDHYVLSNSWWFPGSTIRILFCPSDPIP